LADKTKKNEKGAGDDMYREGEKCRQGFGGVTYMKETTWMTCAYMVV